MLVSFENYTAVFCQTLELSNHQKEIIRRDFTPSMLALLPEMGVYASV